MTTNGTAPPGTHLDFDIHGVIGIRVIDARPKAANYIAAKLGAAACPLNREPDIIVRFVPRLPTAGLRYVEPERTGYTDNDFLILAHRRAPVVVRIPFDRWDNRCEIECVHGARSVPLLDEAIQLTALRKGFVPLHAAAFEYHGNGVVVTGGPHGGKTSALLAFAQAGARFVSDDLVLVDRERGRILGLPSEVSISDWQLEQLPELYAEQRIRRLLFGGLNQLERMQAALGDGVAGRLLQVGVPAVRRRLSMSVPPQRLFGNVESCAADLGTIFLGTSHASSEIVVDAVDPATLASQLATLFRLQLQSCFEYYYAYRFAFPQRRCALLESAESEAHRLLQQVLRKARLFVVRHPHRVSLPRLQQAMELYAAGPSTIAPSLSESRAGSEWRLAEQKV